MRHSSRTRVGRRMDRYIESARTAALCLVHMVAVVVHIEVVFEKKKRGGKRSKYISKGLTNKYMADQNCASIDNSIVQTAACMTPEAGRFNNVCIDHKSIIFFYFFSRQNSHLVMLRLGSGVLRRSLLCICGWALLFLRRRRSWERRRRRHQRSGVRIHPSSK